MPLIPYADLEALRKDHGAFLDALGASKDYNIMRMWAHAPMAMSTGVAFGQSVTKHGKLAPALRELAILATVRIEASLYEWAQHVPLARQAGCTQAQIARLEAGEFDGPAFDARETALLAFVKDVVLNVRASPASLEAARRCFDPAEIVEIIMITGVYTTLGRMTETLGVEIDDFLGAAEPAFGRLK